MQSDNWTLVSTTITTAATAVIAVMAIAQTCIFRRQWRVMRDQLAAMDGQLSEMKATSEQTKKNADALINSERAWVMVGAVAPRIVSGTEVSRGGEERHWLTASIRLSCKNDGRTPAWILAKLVCLKVVRDLSRLPEAPDTGEMQAIQQGYMPLGVGVTTEQDWDVPYWLDRTEREGDVIVLCGVVQYRDALSNNYHETFFGFTVGKINGPLTGRADSQTERIPHTAYNRVT
jgi:hypothetical protein